MKIVLVGTAYPYRGGLAAFNERLAFELQQEGHDIVAYTFTLQYPAFLFPGETQYSENPIAPDIKIKRTINSIKPSSWIKTGNQIRKEKPDLVIFAYWMSFMAPCFGTIARIVKKDKNVECIGLVHNMIPHEKNILDKLFPSYFVKAMDRFVSLSESVIGDIDKFDKKNKPKICSPHPIYDHYGDIIPKNDALSKLNLDPNYNYILFFGFIRTYKGLDILLDALADTRLRSYKIKLIIAGEFYGNEDFYLNKIETLKIKELVELHTHFIPDSEVNTYFCAADMIVQPYKTASQSGVTQIAFHFERPILVTNVGGLSEIVPHQKGGYVVEPNPQTIANALVDFFENKREKDFSDVIKNEKFKYNWRLFTKVIINSTK